MIVGTAGHIDHGKTALVRALTGVDTDRLPEEKRRGITIELGFAPLSLPGGVVAGVVDVPGHEGFVRTMLAGATGIDVALLVVAADEGIMPQTREHLAILRLLGVPAAVIALTKCDLVENDWLELVRADLRELLAPTPFADAQMIATSVVSGVGIEEVRAALAAAATGLAARDRADLFRMPIDRVFSVKGTGTVVTGTVWSGEVARDATLRLLPGDRVVRVRGLQTHGAAAAAIGAGTRGAIAIAGVDHDDAARGATLVGGSAWQETRVLRADVSLLEGTPVEIRPRTRLRFHLGTADVGARVVARGGPLVPGETRPVRIVVDEPVVARAGDRFVLRGTSPVVTVGGGVVTDPLPPFRRARPWATVYAPPAQRLSWLLEESQHEGLPVGSLPARLGVPPGAVGAVVAAQRPEPTRVADRLYPAGSIERVIDGIVRLVREYHLAHPLEPGAPLQQVRAQTAAPPAVAEEAVRGAAAAGHVEVNSGLIAIRGWAPKLSESQAGLIDRLERSIAAAGVEPPTVSELAEGQGEVATVAALLRILERRGVVVQIEGDRYYAREAVDSLVEKLRVGMADGREYAPSDLRDVLGVSRKYLIPFLEFCDRRGVTERRNSGRVWHGM